MGRIPKALLAEILADPYYKTCARKNDECDGRITFEHAWIYAGRQIQAKWAIIPLCVYHHLGEGLEKRINQAIALSRATDQDLLKYPKVDWNQVRAYLKLFAPLPV